MAEIDKQTEQKSTTKRSVTRKPAVKSRKSATSKKSAAKKTTRKKTTGKKPIGKTHPPPGTRMTEALGETFLVDLITDWHEHGGGVIETCRTTKPDAYLKLVATYAPKEFRKTLEPFEGMSDRDLKTRFHEALEEVRALGLDLGS